MSFMAFDMLTLAGQDVMRKPWKDRRKRLEDLFATLSVPRVGLVPVTEDAATLYGHFRSEIQKRGRQSAGLTMLRLRSEPLGKFATCREVFLCSVGRNWLVMGTSEVLAGTIAGTVAPPTGPQVVMGGQAVLHGRLPRCWKRRR